MHAVDRRRDSVPFELFGVDPRREAFATPGGLLPPGVSNLLVVYLGLDHRVTTQLDGLECHPQDRLVPIAAFLYANLVLLS